MLPLAPRLAIYGWNLGGRFEYPPGGATRGAKAGVIDPVAGFGMHHLDHGPDDVALGVELAGITCGVRCDVLQEVLIDFG